MSLNSSSLWPRIEESTELQTNTWKWRHCCLNDFRWSTHHHLLIDQWQLILVHQKVYSMGHSHPNPTSSPCHPLLLWSPRPCWDSAPSWSPLVFPMQLTWWTKRSLSNLSLRRLVSLVISRWSGLWRMYCALISHAGKLLSNFKPLTHQFRQGASPPLGRQGDSNLLEYHNVGFACETY